MNKSVTMNLLGRLYYIDEDGYSLLKEYLENMRIFFESKEGGDEIVADIEMRIAELLSDVNSEERTSVTIDEVKMIIARIGTPEEMIEEGSDELLSSGKEKRPPHINVEEEERKNDRKIPPKWDVNEEQSYKSRKLFRDPQDYILGGVLSGISHYLGISDPLVLRIIFLLLLFLSWSSIAIVYLVLWLLVPEAQTPEDRLRMYGKPVNMNNIRDEVVSSFERGHDYMKAPGTKKALRRIMEVIVSVVVLLFKVFCILLLISVGLLFLIFILTLVFSFLPDTVAFFNLDKVFVEAVHHPGTLALIISFSFLALLSISIPLVSFVRLSRKDKNKSSRSIFDKKGVLFFTWLGVFLFTIVFGFLSLSSYQKKREQLDREKYSLDGVYLGERNCRHFWQSGFHIKDFDNINNCLINENFVSGDTFFGNNYGTYFNLESDSDDRRMSYDFYKEEELRSGDYLFHGWVLSDKIDTGAGNALYVKKDSVLLVQNSVIEDTNAYDDPCKTTKDKLMLLSLYPKFKRLYDRFDDCEKIESLYQQGWRYMQIPFHVDHNQKVEYGLSNKAEYDNNNGSQGQVLWQSVALEYLGTTHTAVLDSINKNKVLSLKILPNVSAKKSPTNSKEKISVKE